jgi:hypothetical protein
MAFTPTTLNYTTEYSKAMANAYRYWSYFSDLYGSPNSATYRPVEGKTVAVQSMTVSGAKAVDRDNLNGVFARNFNTAQQLLEMRMDREWSTLVDPMDIKEDAIVTVANITETFNQFQKIPEMDAYAASQLFTKANAASRTDTTALTAANILAQWDTYLAAMTDARVPRDRIRCKMTPATYKLLKEATGLPVTMWDERRTTVEAHNILSQHNYHGKKRKETVDAVAASLILEGYLNFRKR